MSLLVNLPDGVLHAVPAEHRSVPFAIAVHAAMRQPADVRPAAIAVELGPDAAAQAVVCVRALRQVRPPGGPFPCLAGVLLPNGLIHPAFRSRARVLQRALRASLEAVPDRTRQQHLATSEQEMVCFSPVDSITEAVRCGVDSDVPVYGIDAHGCANVWREACLGEDGGGFLRDPDGFVRRQVPRTEPGRDVWVDGRREAIMAAHLRWILRRHGRVLYTGGIAHWAHLLAQLETPDGAAAEPLRRGVVGRTVVVAPDLALPWLDAGPRVVERYEAWRASVAETGRIDVLGALEGVWGGHNENILRMLADVLGRTHAERLPVVAGHLAGMTLLAARRCHAVADAIVAVRDLVSQEAAAEAGRVLVRDALPWLRPEEWPDAGVLHRVVPEGRSAAAPSREVFLGEPGGQGSRPVSVKPPGDEPRVGVAGGPGGSCTVRARRGRPAGAHWVWPPCERRLFSTAYDAARLALEQRGMATSEVFAGSLLDGFDARGTIRERARGGRLPRVRCLGRATRLAERDAIAEPVVFLFEPEGAGLEADRFSLLRAGGDLAAHVRDRAAYEEFTDREGGAFVSSILLGRELSVPPRLEPFVASTQRIDAGLLFGNPCLNGLQSARWLEAGRFRVCPALHRSGFRDVLELYARRHAIALSAERPREMLVLCGLPYCRERVVVVDAGGFHSTPAIAEACRRLRRRVDVVEMSAFPAAWIERIRLQHTVRTHDLDGLVVDPALEVLLGEGIDADAALLPSWISAQAISP